MNGDYVVITSVRYRWGCNACGDASDKEYDDRAECERDADTHGQVCSDVHLERMRRVNGALRDLLREARPVIQRARLDANVRADTDVHGGERVMQLYALERRIDKALEGIPHPPA